MNLPKSKLLKLRNKLKEHKITLDAVALRVGKSRRLVEKVFSKDQIDTANIIATALEMIAAKKAEAEVQTQSISRIIDKL